MKEYDPDMDIERAMLERAYSLKRCECCNLMFKPRELRRIRLGNLDFDVCQECADLLGQ